MSQIMTEIKIGIAIVSLGLMLTACGSSSPNSNNAFNNEEPQGHSEAGEVVVWHPAAAKANLDSCKECHGADLLGGISGVSCSQCHLGGATSAHPVSWGTGTSVITFHQQYAALNGTSSCANEFCHGTNLQGVANSGPACSTCH